jgi:HAD superfamily hydrolase (TIGR01549 family)
MIRAIIFDFGQTLADSADGFRAAEKEVQAKIFSDLVSISKIDSRETFLDMYRLIRKKNHDTSIFSRFTTWQAVYRHYHMEPQRVRLENWETSYWEKVKSNTRLFPETRQVLDNLSTNYRLALITNTQGQKTTDAHRLSLYPELENFFEVIIVAGEGDIPPKPDPKPFRLCLKNLGLRNSEAVYVGDDWRIDICGAKNAGLRPVWLKHRNVRRNWPVVEISVPIITSLSQLLDLNEVLSHESEKPSAQNGVNQ